MSIEPHDAKGERVPFAAQTRDETIDRLYDVALDPARYETLLDHWERVVGPLREMADLSDAQLLDDPLIANHFKRASEILDRADIKPNRKGYHHILAPFERVAAFVVDPHFALVGFNGAAEALFGIRADAKLDQLPVEADDVQAVRDTVLRLMRTETSAASVLRVRSTDAGQLFILRMQRCDTAAGKPLVLAASSAMVWPDGFSDILRAAFKLSKVEADIVKALVKCCSVAEIAQERGRSIDTIRAQIKSILAKTETRSQVELVRLSLSMMDMANLTFNTEPGPQVMSRGYAALQERAFDTITTADGRRLDYLVLGKRDGRAILFLPLDYSLVRWPASAEQEAEARGFRVIVPVRPGYGKSDPLPAAINYQDGCVDDWKTLLSHEGVTHCPVISLGDDAHRAFLFAAAAPETVTAIIACGGVLPLTRREQYERMAKWHRFILAGARYTPHLVPFMVKAGFMLARKIGKRGFLHAVYGQSSADVATFEDPEVFEAMVTGSETALSETHSAHESFSRIVIDQQRDDWSSVPADLAGKLPVHFINGAHDPEVPMATLAEFQVDYPWIDYRVYEDAGQLVFFRHWRDVLDLVETYLP